MNKKNKGFTTIELITSFTLASVIMIILFNIILILKDNLSEVNAKTNMLVEKDNLSYNINKRFKDKEISSITACEDGDKCYEFTYSDDTSDKLIYSSTDKTITFNNYTFDIIDGITVQEPVITEHYDTMSSTKYNGYFIIHIPIKLNNKDYSIKINKHFNTDSLVVDLRDSIFDNNGNRYVKVEYLESTGTQYINTLFKPSGDTKIELKYQTPTQNKTQQGIFGARDSGPNRFTVFTAAVKDGFQVDYMTQESLAFYRINIQGVDGTAINTIKMSNAFIVNDNIVKEVTKNSFHNSLNMYLFANNNNGTAQLPMVGYVWYFRIYDNDTLVRDYIPVIDSTERPCLFDKVEKKCYYNQGTGEFLYG